MTENEIAAIAGAVLTTVIAGYFGVRQVRINKKTALEQQFEDLKAEVRKGFAVQDIIQQQILAEAKRTNGNVTSLLDWKEKTVEIIARMSEKIANLEKK